MRLLIDFHLALASSNFDSSDEVVVAKEGHEVNALWGTPLSEGDRILLLRERAMRLRDIFFLGCSPSIAI